MSQSAPRKIKTSQGEAENHSLSEVYRTVPVPYEGSFWRKLWAFIGPGYLVAVGYMDPGNWATSLAGGSSYGYRFLAVIMLSNFIAIYLQALCARLGIVTGHDLAQACRNHFSNSVNFFLWFLAEIAICATDLAEVLGTAIALQLLFHIPLPWGVVLTALDVLLLLWLQKWGIRKLEAFVISLLTIITLCFCYNLFLAKPNWGAVFQGYKLTRELFTKPDMLYLTMGILGATVMPHNLYLHSSLVQTRRFKQTEPGRRNAIRSATVDSVIALMLALFINSAILILAAAAFYASGHTEVVDIQQAYKLLAPVLGVSFASTAFGVALLASGLNSTITATLAGQVVMEGFLSVRLPFWLRRLITRLVAIFPATVVIMIWGVHGTTSLLIFSQVILSLQLPFAVIPLLMFVGNKTKMGQFALSQPGLIIGWGLAFFMLVLNIKMVWDFL